MIAHLCIIEDIVIVTVATFETAKRKPQVFDGYNGHLVFLEYKWWRTRMRKIKDMWEKSYGEGTKFDLDYGKLIIVFLCIYIAIKVT